MIQPMTHWQYWSDESQKVHGLDRRMLFENGVDSMAVAQHLNALLAGQQVHYDAIAWGSFWARVLFSDNGVHQRFALSDLTSLFQADALTEAYLSERARLENSGQYRLHSAIDDARILLKSLTRALGK